MGPSPGTCEIVELKGELDSVHCSSGGTDSPMSKSRMANKTGKNPMLKSGRNSSFEDDLNQLYRAIDIRTSCRSLSLSSQTGSSPSQRNALKRPMKVGASGIGISESVSLKQALRKLCISQASEMAAMKRLSKPGGLSGISEAGTIKKLYRSVVVEAGSRDHSFHEGNGGMLEISLVPENRLSNLSEKTLDSPQIPERISSNQSAHSSPQCIAATTSKEIRIKTQPQDEIQVLERDEIVPVSTENRTSIPEIGQKGKLHSSLSVFRSNAGGGVSKSPGTSPRLIKPVLRNKGAVKRKEKQDSNSASNSSNTRHEVENNLEPSTSKVISQTPNCSHKNIKRESSSPASSSTNLSVEVSSSNAVSTASKPGLSSNGCNKDRSVGPKAKKGSESKEKGEFSQSSKSSMGEYSSSTSISEESNLSASNSNGNRPHMSKDLRWEAIHHIETQSGSISLRHFKLLKRLGCGDIGTVYLAELTGTNCVFALKIMDNEFLASRKKMARAQTEKDILQMLDHPFLPTLYAYFTTDKFSCLVMEYCPGGDLHVLRQKQPGRSFSEQAARFYVAEVLLALEYLHMLGVVYRDLKPENILVRVDGHIMLSDFDLSLRCAVNPMLVKSSAITEPAKRYSGPCTESSCIDPFCLQPSWVQVPCFTPRLISTSAKTRKLKSDMASQISPLPQLVAEPTSARSNSFVGTHEYLAPEIIKGDGHGSAVDWWTFGIFLYELLFGRTPFKGLGNEETLANVVSQCLKFPESPPVSFQARDLIKGLLVKEPENRLGSVKGAAEIKQHPFFEGLNWALIRCTIPPELPKSGDVAGQVVAAQKTESKCVEFGENGDNLEFELF